VGCCRRGCAGRELWCHVCRGEWQGRHSTGTVCAHRHEHCRQAGRPAMLTFRVTRPYWKGLMPSLPSRVAWEADTRSPAWIRCTFWVISMVPLLILVAIPRAWKKEVWEGSMPVPPEGMCTSLGASRPTRAGAPTLYLAISSFRSASSALVKMMPTLPTWEGGGGKVCVREYISAVV
jgi:hypothetical protein